MHRTSPSSMRFSVAPLRGWILLFALFGLSGCYGAGGGGGTTGDDDDSAGDDDDASGDDDDYVPPTDVDGDGILNTDEGMVSAVDTDGDGIIDAEDADSDNDGISDAEEAGDDDPDTPPVDSDGDGTPDFRDEDSDNDGLPDSLEAGDSDLDTPPADSDNDGVPDSLELDSDDDGIADSAEGSIDSDGDGVPNFQDTDSDGDGVDDAVEGISDPDNDGAPAYLDLDADGDSIPDSQEGGWDSDGDGVPNNLDLDSDGDTIADATEGMGDTDGDTVPDCQDTDSDGDLLSDEFEALNGTSTTSADTDGDGVSDLIEIALGTGVLDATDNPAENGDLVFVSPSRESVYPSVQTVSATTNFQQVDVYFMIDRTGSMSGEISAIKSAVTTIIDDLTCIDYGVACVEDANCGSSQVCSLWGSCIDDPAVHNCVPSLWSGVGEYGGSDDPPFEPAIVNLQSLTASPAVTQAAVPGSTGSGADEVMFRAAECTANPSACTAQQLSGCSTSGVGCPGFRDDSARILIEVTDEQDESSPGWGSAATAGAALAATDITFIGLDADTGHEGLSDLTAIAQAAGSLDSVGQPFVRSGSDSGVVAPIESAIFEIIGDVTMDTAVEIAEVAGDDGDALPFLDHIAVNLSGDDLDGDGVVDCNVVTTSDADGDGFDDSHHDVLPGLGVCWDVFPANNDHAQETAEIQTYILEVTLRGNGAIIDQMNVYFVVPPFAPK